MRAVWRGLALVCAVACVVGSGWLGWTTFGERMAAMAAIGPADGVLTVSRCFDLSDAEGYSLGTGCEGTFRPSGGVGRRDGLKLRGADEKYRAGTRVEVRLADGIAFERSAVSFVQDGATLTLMGVVIGVPVAWLVASARRGRPVSGDGYVFALIAGTFCTLVLGLVVGLLTGLVAAVL